MKYNIYEVNSVTNHEGEKLLTKVNTTEEVWDFIEDDISNRIKGITTPNYYRIVALEDARIVDYGSHRHFYKITGGIK